MDIIHQSTNGQINDHFVTILRPGQKNNHQSKHQQSKSTIMKIKREIVATRENEQIILTVTHEGRALTCPLKQPIPVQNQFGSMNFIEHNCSSKCIGFDCQTNDLKETYFVCGFSQNLCFEVDIDNGINEIPGEKIPKILKLD